MSAAITEFGKILRKLRIDSGEVLFDMAKKLNWTSAYLSAIEVGKRPVPEGMVDNLVMHYRLTGEQAKDLYRAVDLDKKNVKLDLAGLSPSHRNAAVVFARTFKEVDDDVLKQILALLDKGDHSDV